MKSELVVVVSFDSHNTTFASWHIFTCHIALRLFKNRHNTKFRVVAFSVRPQRVVVIFSAQWAFSIFDLNRQLENNDKYYNIILQYNNFLLQYHNLMATPSYMRSVDDWNAVMRRLTINVKGVLPSSTLAPSSHTSKSILFSPYKLACFVSNIDG